tara:strand:+ start:931 stop:1089 length:159 start_codon:yes stop_codon:yes gene_type:complete
LHRDDGKVGVTGMEWKYPIAAQAFGKDIESVADCVLAGESLHRISSREGLRP